MGISAEQDEKENVPAGTPTAEIETEPKETEKLLNTDEKKPEIDSPTNAKDTPAEEVKSEVAPEKVNGEEVIEIPEEKKPKEEGREVKPKKIPIGGIKMPGFFTRNKSKPTDTDGAEGELLDNAGNEAKAEEAPKDETAAPPSARTSFFASLPPLTLPKFRNPFARKATPPKDEETGDATNEAKTDDVEPTAGKQKIYMTISIFSYQICESQSKKLNGISI